MGPEILVIYATSEGQTAKIAAHMAETLRGQGLAVTLVNAGAKRPVNPANYAAVIVAASVHARKFQKSVRDWARLHRQALASRPCAFVGVCLAVLSKSPGANQEIQTVLDGFIRDTGWTPAETKIVAGALPYTKYGWFTRWIMRRIVAKNGGDTDTGRDYEYTDWDDLRAFATRFAAQLTRDEARVEAVAR